MRKISDSDWTYHVHKVDWRQRADCMASSVAVCNCDAFPPNVWTTVGYRYSFPLSTVKDIMARLLWQLWQSSMSTLFKACSTGSRVTWHLWLDTFHRLTVKCMSTTRSFRLILCNMLVLSTVEHNYLVVDVCYLLHKYQLHVSALMAIFRLNDLTKKNIGY